MARMMRKSLDRKVFRRTAIATKKENYRLSARGGKRF